MFLKVNTEVEKNYTEWPIYNARQTSEYVGKIKNHEATAKECMRFVQRRKRMSVTGARRKAAVSVDLGWREARCLRIKM